MLSTVKLPVQLVVPEDAGWNWNWMLMNFAGSKAVAGMPASVGIAENGSCVVPAVTL
jgi:hypothetical protein